MLRSHFTIHNVQSTIYNSLFTIYIVEVFKQQQSVSLSHLKYCPKFVNFSPGIFSPKNELLMLFKTTCITPGRRSVSGTWGSLEATVSMAHAARRRGDP